MQEAHDDFVKRQEQLNDKVTKSHTDESIIRGYRAYLLYRNSRVKVNTAVTLSDFIKYAQYLHLDNRNKEYVCEVSILSTVKDTVAKLSYR